MNKLDHLIKSIDRLVELNEEMLREIRGVSDKVSAEPTEWIDALEVQKMLEMSRSSLYRRTKDETFQSKSIGSRKYYAAEEIPKIKARYSK